jgi:hypothetical protein
MDTLNNEFREEYDTTKTCPNLGMRRDPETQYAFSTRWHVCFGVDPPEAIKGAYQVKYCLGPDHVRCIVNTSEELKSLPQEIVVEPITSRRGKWRYVIGACAVILLLIVWDLISSNGFIFSGRITPISFDEISSIVEVKTEVKIDPSRTNIVTIGDSPDVTPAPLTETPIQFTSTPTIHPTWTQQPTTTTTPPPTPGPGLGTPFGEDDVYVVYRVQEGQSLLALAEFYDTSPEAIQAANVLREGRTVWPGDIIVIPVGQSDPGQVIQFVSRFVEKKTSIIDLAEDTGASIDVLRRYNLLGAEQWIPAGRWLIIPAAGN